MANLPEEGAFLPDILSAKVTIDSSSTAAAGRPRLWPPTVARRDPREERPAYGLTDYIICPELLANRLVKNSASAASPPASCETVAEVPMQRRVLRIRVRNAPSAAG